MAVYWVQQWIALPIIVEEPMGDTGNAGRLMPDQQQLERSADSSALFPGGYTGPSNPSSSTKGADFPQHTGLQIGNPPFFSQYNSLPQMNQIPQDVQSGGQPSTRPHNFNPRHEHSFNMASMTEALPNFPGNHPHQGMQQQVPQSNHATLSGASTSALVYQLQQISQYPGQPGAIYPSQLGANTGYPANSYPNMYSQRSAGPSPTQQTYHQASPQNQPYYYYPNQYGQTTPSPPFATHPSQINNPYDRPFNVPQTGNVGHQHPYMQQQQHQMRAGQPSELANFGSQFGGSGSEGM
ncbi:MAG: hypothetical protein M1821_006427 [Bathelium mastoideum]|nr:MAG: hypothetical protein M1821_006427 [Bathelium mastoideum]KAI9693704.1 MAG: hypothetical protein M1822_002975 [Bathelium mastoideum]